MLAQKTFPQARIDHCRKGVTGTVNSFRALNRDAKLDAFEPQLVCNLVLALDRCFVHRQRGLEGEGESALKRTRDLAEAVAEGRPELLSLDEFEQLAEAFFADLEAKFGAA